MTIKKFKEEFNLFLERKGFFQNLEKLSQTHYRERYGYDKENYNIKDVVKFANSPSGNNYKNIEFRFTKAALKISGFDINCSSNPEEITSLSIEKVLSSWFLPVLKDFFINVKNESWYSEKSRDAFINSIIHDGINSYPQKEINLQNNLVFLKEELNWSSEKLFDFFKTSILLPEAELSVTSSLTNVYLYLSDSYMGDFKKYIRDNIKDFEDSLKKELNIYTDTNDKKINSYCSHQLRLNAVLRKSARENDLSADSKDFFESIKIPEFDLKVLQADTNNYKYFIIGCEQLTAMSIENTNIIENKLQNKPCGLSFVKNQRKILNGFNIAINEFFANNSEDLLVRNRIEGFMDMFNANPENIEDSIARASSINLLFKNKFPDEFNEKKDFLLIRFTDKVKHIEIMETITDSLVKICNDKNLLNRLSSDYSKKNENVPIFKEVFEYTKAENLMKKLNDIDVTTDNITPEQEPDDYCFDGFKI